MDFLFLFNSVLLGAGLAMDAFSVSLANGIHEPFMKKRKMAVIAGTFGFFQFLMPLLGWICVHWVVDIFQSVLPYIPWIALILLFTLGFMMIKDGFSGEEEEVCPETSFKCLLVQGLATSMDALSVGFTIASYGWMEGSSGFVLYHRRGNFPYLPFRHRPGPPLWHEAGGQGHHRRRFHPHGHRTGNLPDRVRGSPWRS